MIGEDPKIPDQIKGRMTAMERLLARRIHNQRRQLRQWDTWKSWHTLTARTRRMYMDMYSKAAKREREATEKLAAFKAGRPFWHRVLDHFNIKP